MKKEKYIFYYQVVVQRCLTDDGEDLFPLIYNYSILKEAKKKYSEVKSSIGKSWCNVRSVKLKYFLHYFDNCGHLVMCHGDTKKHALANLLELIDNCK